MLTKWPMLVELVKHVQNKMNIIIKSTLLCESHGLFSLRSDSPLKKRSVCCCFKSISTISAIENELLSRFNCDADVSCS